MVKRYLGDDENFKSVKLITVRLEIVLLTLYTFEIIFLFNFNIQFILFFTTHSIPYASQQKGDAVDHKTGSIAKDAHELMQQNNSSLYHTCDTIALSNVVSETTDSPHV